MKLELYYYKQCPFCRYVTNKIEELNIQDKIEYKNTLEVSEYRQEHLSITGRTTVPCLYINGTPLFESQDIMKWLEDNKSSL
ncbi:MAG: glutathione S-transferase N-terminal domain-containing protein [Flavobacteriaceae bacterium]|nr:glutathione S-transferase N-terminal domain-containing protein [Flavobacteriaceae bacterium]